MLAAVLFLALSTQDATTISGPAADFARRLEGAVAKGELISLDISMDADAFYNRVIGSTKLSQGLEEFLKPLIRMSFTSGPYFATLKGRITYKFLRIRKAEEGLRALFRVTGQGAAFNYHELLLVPDADSFRIVDYFLLNFEGFQSELTRRCVMPSPKLLKLFNELDIRPNPADMMTDYASNVLGQVSHLVSSGEYQKALDKYYENVETLKNVGIAQVLHVNAARMIDQATHEKALREMSEAFKSGPAIDIATLGGCLEFQQLDGALKCIDRLEKSLGGDVFLNVLRGNAYLGSKQAAKARDLYRTVTEAEPTLDQGWWSLITAHLALKEFKEVVRCLNAVENHLKVTLGDLSTTKTYSEFVDSPEYAEWMKGRNPK
jgi:tetratricopeptide (TPR) repeat protein